jgi:DNA-binding SARP family transcriptional activator
VVDLPSASQRRLLAVLALHSRRSVRAEWLAEELGVSPGGLRTQVLRLRRGLGARAVSTGGAGYRLDANVDANAFCVEIAAAPEGDLIGALNHALGRWTGLALEEFASEAWAAGDAARLNELHASATEDLAAGLVAASRCSEAVAMLEAQVAAYPLRDRSRGLLMEALAGEGRQAEALRVFQQYRVFLAEEVGTEPSVEVREIEQRIATSWVSVEIELPPPSALVEAHMIGGAWERRMLDEGMTRARASGLQTVLISGEAGIGKTTLLAAFAAEVRNRDGLPVLYARCDDGAAVALQPFRSLVGWCVEHVSTALLEAHVARCGGELLRVAPQLAARTPTPHPTTSDDATERFLLFEAVADVLRRLAGSDGLVVMLDDLHWAEPTALALLRHLTSALVSAPVLLIASFRDGAEHVTEELRLALADLDRGEARRIKLRGFDDADLADLVTVELGPSAADVATRLRDDSAGNPLYATQLIRYWVESGLVEREDGTVRFCGDRPGDAIPPSLRDVVWRRVGALGPQTAAVLSAGAVLGIEFEADLLAALVDAEVLVVDRALDAANTSGLLGPVDPATGTMRFTHALVANALYAELPPLRRRRLHERAARALDSGGDDLPQKTIVQLARHCALGGLRADAMRWATVAGDHALGHLAPSEAATWYGAALEHCTALGRPDAERADLVVRLGEALHRAGNPSAYATMQEGAELATRCGAPSVLIRAALSTDRGFMQVGSSAPQQLAIVEAAVSGDPLLEFATHVAAYTVAIELADPVAAARSLATMRAIASDVGAPRMRWTVGIYETFEATMAARLDDAESIAGKNLDLGLQIGEPDAFTVFSVGFFAIGTFAGRHAELFPVVEQLSNDAPTASPMRIAYGIISAAVDHEDVAREILAEGCTAGFAEIPRDAFWMTSVIGYAVLAIELADAAAAELLFPIIEPFGAEVAFNGASSQGPVSAYLGKLASLLGWHDVADEHLHAALEITTAFGWEYHRATTLIALAESRLRRAGALDTEARAQLDQAQAICDKRGLRSWAKKTAAMRG